MGDSYSLTNLIINYIPQRMSDEDLKTLFGSLGVVKSCRIIRDKSSGISYGFGFCEYEDSECAQKAVETYNGYRLQNKVLKVAFARLPGQESKNCNLYIQNLPPSLTKDELENRYAKYGKIIQCRIVKDNNGKSRRIGFVLFESRSSAEQAMQFTTDKPWPNYNDCVIQVRFADDNSKKVRPVINPHVNSHANPGMLPNNNNFGGPAPWKNEPFQFANNGSSGNGGGGGGGGPMRHSGMFYGGGNRFNPMVGPAPGLNSSILGGFAPTPVLNDKPVANSQSAGHVLYVYNCGNMSNEKLIALFAQFGAITKADIPRDASGNSKNFGFVTFFDYNSAMAAINCMNGYNLNGKALQVSLKKDKHSA